MTQGLGVYRKLLREQLSITSFHTYIHKELAQARIKDDIRAAGKLVDCLRIYSPIRGNKIQSSGACPQVSRRQQN